MFWSQDRVLVNTFYRQTDGIWSIGPSAGGLDQSITLRSIGIDIPLADIYGGVEMPPAPKPKTEPV